MIMYKPAFSSFYCFIAIFFLTGFSFTTPLPAMELSNADDISDLFELSIEKLMTVKITVASKFLEPDLLVGSSVAQIRPDHWHRLGARRISDALINQTGVMTFPSVGGNNPIYIRGYATDTGGIITMIDNVPVISFRTGASTFLPNFELGNLNGIELLKGPGSAIYGSDAFHGVIAYNTFSMDEDYYYADAAGAYPLYGDASMKVSHGMADGHVRIDMAAGFSGQDALDLEYEYKHGYFPPGIYYPEQPEQLPGEGTGIRENKYQTQTSVFKLTISPTERTRLSAGTYLARNKFDGFPGLSSLIGNLKARDTSSKDSLFLMGTGSLSHRYDNDITLKVGGYYWWAEDADTMNVDEYGTFNHTVSDEYRAGVDLTIKQPDNIIGLQWLFAYAFDTMKIKSATSTGYNAYLGRLTSHYDELFAGFSRDIHCIYGQAKYSVITDQLYLLLGGRLDIYSDYDKQLTPRGGLIYLPVDDLSIKALYGRGFMAGDGRELAGIIYYTQGNPDIKPEVIDVYELIFMYKHESLKATVNGFYSYWQDGIVRKAAPELAPKYRSKFVNEGENQSYGAEFNFIYSLNPFAVELGFSYINSSALNIVDPNDSTNTIDQTYVAFPEYFINIGLYYSIERFAVDFYLNNRLYINMKETPPSGSYPAPNDLSTYWRTDLNVKKAIAERAEVILDIRNLLNRENRVPSFFGAKDGIEEPGISVLLRICYEF